MADDVAQAPPVEPVPVARSICAFRDQNGNWVDAETGDLVDLEAVLAQPKRPEDVTLEEAHASAEARNGGPLPPPNPASVAALADAMSQAGPSWGRQAEEAKAFLQKRYPDTFSPKQAATVWTAPLDLRRRATECAGRQHPRARQERRSVGASAGGGDPPEGESDEPPDRVVLRPPLSRRERAFLRVEIDRLRRRQLVDERDHLRAVPVGGWPA
jgi:hypothetical protein